jgi:hypothetical protein
MIARRQNSKLATGEMDPIGACPAKALVWKSGDVEHH